MNRMVILLALCATAAYSQNAGTINGTVVDSDGAAVANAQIQATNRSTKMAYKTAGSDKGQYSLATLPPGSYDVSISAPGFYPYNQSNVSVQSTEPLRLDVHLLEYQLGTLGDGREFRVQLTSPHSAPSGPTPRTADGKPDLSGVWFAQRTVDAGKPEPLPWVEALLRERAANNGKDAPGARCLPRGITNAGALFPFKLVQTPTLLVMLFEDDIPSHRQVFLDGRGQPKDPNPMWMGHSIGHWDGDTLVIETVGFDDRSWLDNLGHPHTEMMHLTERFRRPDLGHLEIEFTIDDPGAYAKPWKINRASELDAGDDIGEYVCTENEKDSGHMVGK
ncbi:MAG: carboxypeptidase-like regulatory domain-containing protein [Bryobacteraceae bacterium]